VVGFFMNSMSMLGPGYDMAVQLLLSKMPDLGEQGWIGYYTPALGTIRATAIHPGKPGKEYSREFTVTRTSVTPTTDYQVGRTGYSNRRLPLEQWT
jgi:hypothetical protein